MARVAQFVARCAEDIIKARGVKPTLSPNLDTLATVEALSVKRLLFIGVGCQVPAHACSPAQDACPVCCTTPRWHPCMHAQQPARCGQGKLCAALPAGAQDANDAS